MSDKAKNNPFIRFRDFIAGVCMSVFRTTVRYFKNIPHRIKFFVKKKINEYKRKPKRKDINRVYVLVGYTSRKNVDARYNAERYMMILRRGLLILILVLLLFISLNKILPMINSEQYETMFGIGSVDKLTEEDPFENSGTSGK
ncbi:MAG: hypothetical protein IKN14_05605 [Clostridiales bacterium]|nr:hypothetical protein [Clostridiales bacterium]